MLRCLCLGLVLSVAAAFTPPAADLSRRSAVAAGLSALALGSPAFAYSSAPIRKANQDLIGVSTVPIPAKGEGNKGANIPTVALKKGWEGKTSVLGPDGATAKGTNGFWAGGESQKEKDAIMKNPVAISNTKRMFDGKAGYNTLTENP